MTNNLYEKFERYLAEKHLTDHTQRILLAVSGGVDSMVLLSLFASSGYRVGVPTATSVCAGPRATRTRLW